MKMRDELETIFRSDRALREAETRMLASGDAEALADVLAVAVDEALKLGDRREATMRLERLADLCAQVPGPRMADALVAILDDDDPAVRVAAGEALLDVGFERYAEVALAVERALAREKPGLALAELPWILSEIGEPSAHRLLERFLASPSPDVVASAIEALASLGDPAALPLLEPLRKDARKVSIDEGDEQLTTTIGELASDAVEELSGRRE